MQHVCEIGEGIAVDEFDAETAKYYNRARYYDSSAGRFINEDPSGFNDGVNFYRYVHNNPIDNADPFGLTTYKGFPPDLEIQMRNAVNDLLNKLSPTGGSTGGCESSNPPCAGKDSPKLAKIVHDATFVYQPNSKDCGQTGFASLFGLRHTFGVGSPAFGSQCGPLASTLLHEVVHGMRHPSEKKPLQLEKDCFGN
jgi:RHS repeat-associated protein